MIGGSHCTIAKDLLYYLLNAKQQVTIALPRSIVPQIGREFGDQIRSVRLITITPFDSRQSSAEICFAAISSPNYETANFQRPKFGQTKKTVSAFVKAALICPKVKYQIDTVLFRENPILGLSEIGFIVFLGNHTFIRCNEI